MQEWELTEWENDPQVDADFADFPFPENTEVYDAIQGLTFGRDQTSPQTTGLAIDLQALGLPSVTGERVDLRELAGSVVLINVFATWCGPCNDEIPLLIKLHEQFAEKGLRIIAISRKEEPEVVRDFVKANNIPYTVLVDVDGKGTDQYSPDGDGVPVPTNMILDRELAPVFLDVGFSGDHLLSLRAKIQELID
jgi:thiol-disulfide isomerase/thioredoxin